MKELIVRDYPGRWDYTLFKVDCDDNYHPILLRNGSSEKKQLFGQGVKIKKLKNSQEFQLTSTKNEISKLEFRAPEEETDDVFFKFSIPIIYGFFLSGCLLVVVNFIWKIY